MPAEDEAESTTKATVSEGEIEIRDKENQKQDLAGLNRDTQNALNKLGEIFDKDSIEERQELAGLFGELAYNQIHYMEGTDEQKAAYHALVGGIMSELVGGNFAEGASAAGINKMLSSKIYEVAKGDPALTQWLSAAVGAGIGSFWNNMQVAASITVNGTKNNYLAVKPAEKIEIVVWKPKLSTNMDQIEVPHIAIRVTYDDGSVEELHYGNYTTEKPEPFGPGTILDVNSGSYVEKSLNENKAYILDTIVNDELINKVIDNANIYMSIAKEISKDSLRSDVKKEHGYTDIDAVYEPQGIFEKYNIIFSNCLDFTQAIFAYRNEKLNNFKNIDFLKW